MKTNKVETHDIDLSRRLLLRENTAFSVKEAYFRLRTNLTFCLTGDRKHPCKTFMVTSYSPAEGKSTVTANIALSFAMLEKKTLIVDCDMRRPTQGRLWNVEVHCGIAEHLAMQGELEICKVEGELPLYLAVCSSVPNNPTAMLSSEAMKNLLAKLAEQYDYILIDTPPLSAMTDAQILAPLTDGVVIVAKSGFTTRESLNHASRLIAQAGGNLCGIALNQMAVDTSLSKYGSYPYA